VRITDKRPIVQQFKQNCTTVPQSQRYENKFDNDVTIFI